LEGTSGFKVTLGLGKIQLSQNWFKGLLLFSVISYFIS